MACLNCLKHFSQHDEHDLFVCINFYVSEFSSLVDNYRKLLDENEELKNSKTQKGGLI